MPFQQDPYMQSSQAPPDPRYDDSTDSLPPEAMSPGGYPPSSGLPPGAASMLSGMQPGMMNGGAGGGAANPDGSSLGPGMAGMDGAMGAQMAGMPSQDPMQAIRQQVDPVVIQLQMLAQAYPMATEEWQAAGEAIARGMLKIAQGVQPDPMRPPVPA